MNERQPSKIVRSSMWHVNGSCRPFPANDYIRTSLPRLAQAWSSTLQFTDNMDRGAEYDSVVINCIKLASCTHFWHIKVCLHFFHIMVTETVKLEIRYHSAWKWNARHVPIRHDRCNTHPPVRQLLADWRTRESWVVCKVRAPFTWTGIQYRLNNRRRY